MAFPSDHAYPVDLPVWLLDGHQMTAGERVEAAQFEQGEDRQREIRTFTPWLASVSTILEQAEFDRFDEWFENDIQGGALRFDTLAGGLNGALVQWWEAQFLGPYRFEAMDFSRFRVSAELILLDGPYDAGFDPGSAGDTRVAPSLAGRSIGESDATARFATPGLRGWTDGDSELWALSTNSLRGWSEGDSELLGEFSLASLLALEDGELLLLEGDAGSEGIYLEP